MNTKPQSVSGAAANAARPPFPAPDARHAARRISDPAGRFGPLQPRRGYDPGVQARAVREHARGRHFG